MCSSRTVTPSSFGPRDAIMNKPLSLPMRINAIKSKVMAVDLSLKKEDISLTRKWVQKHHHQ